MLDLAAALGAERIADDRVVAAPNVLRTGIAEPLRKSGGALDVGEEDGMDG